MLKLFKRLFQKPPVPERAVLRPVIEPAPAPLAKVETANLSLAAIIARFPAELKATVVHSPDPETMVALPLSTILKQLPSGSVKMSLASIYRQAPAGTFSARVEEKRMIEIPLAEIFKRVKPDLLKRRDDQRMHELAEEDGFDVFGDPENPYAIAPTEPQEAVIPPPAPAPAVPLAAPAGLKLATAKFPAPELAQPLCATVPEEPIFSAPPAKSHPATAVLTAPSAIAPASARPGGSSVVLPLPDISVNWPPEVLAEISSLTGSTVSLPASGVTAGLAKGKVLFTWGEIRSWISPALDGETAAKEALELLIPLRIIAPAFLKTSKEGSARKKLAVDDSIPELFAGGPGKPTSEPEAPQALIPGPSPELSVSIEGPALEPVDVEEPAANPLPSSVPIDAGCTTAYTIAEIFGVPPKDDWSPAEIVQHITKLPEVAGAVVALQEGLVVAHSLPEPMKGEVVAAFLPQIFSRLNQYSGEMKLGEIDDLLMSTHGAYFQIFRLGYVFFAVLGKPGESLPWHALRIVAEELARQTQK